MRAKDRPLENDFVSDEEFDRLLHAWFGDVIVQRFEQFAGRKAERKAEEVAVAGAGQ